MGNYIMRVTAAVAYRAAIIFVVAGAANICLNASG